MNAGIKASSAQTLFRNAKRKLDKMYGNGNADANVNGAPADLSPEETSSKRGKSTAKAPRTPKIPKSLKVPKPLKAPKAPKTPKTPKDDKAATKTEKSAGQVSANPITTKSAADVAGGTFRDTAIAEPAAEPVAEPSASATTTTEATKLQTEQDEEANDKIDSNKEAARDLAANQPLLK